MHSIRIKITAVTMAAILTSLLAFIGIGYITIAEESDRNSVEKMNLLSPNVKKTVDARLDSLKQAVNMADYIAEDSLKNIKLADYGVKGSRTPEQQKQLDTVIKDHCDKVLSSFSSIADHTNSIVTYYYCISSDVGSTEHGFFYSKVGDTEFKEQPKLIADELDPNDTVHTTWYYMPIRQGKACWVGPYKAHFLGELLTVSYVSPIFKDGTLIGVLGMDALFYSVRSPVQAVRVYDTGFACLLDSKGHILSHPKLDMGKTLKEISPNLSPEVFERENNGTDLIRYDADGQKRQLSYTTLTNGLKLVVTAPVKEIFSSWHQMTRSILMIAIAILSVFAVITLIIVGAVTKPLQRLTLASQKLADGDYDVGLEYEGDDEVGILTQSFRRLRDHLKIYIDDLNNRAYTDALTGIKNKGALAIFTGRLNDLIRHGGKEKVQEFAFIVLDCNNLKIINDQYGHIQGDIYLRTASNAICKTFTHSPVFRLGGDEFGVLLQQQDYRNRERLLQSFDSKVEEINAAAENPWEKIDIARGIAVYQPDLDTDVESVMKRADELMYENKKMNKQYNSKIAFDAIQY